MSRAAGVALAVTMCTVAPASLGAQNTCVDSTDKEVRDLEFRGNRALSDDDLALRVATTPSAWLRRRLGVGGTKRCLSVRVLARDVVGLRSYYHSRGFLQATVQSQVDSLGPSAVRVVFNIDEGLPTILKSYMVTGLDGLPDSGSIMRRLRLRVGEPWDRGLFAADMDSISSRLRNAGYFRAEVYAPLAEHDSTRSARAEIRVIPGKLAHFGPIDPQVTPAPDRDQQISDGTVRRLLGIREGQRFSTDAIRDAQRSLFQLATYRQVEVVPRSLAEQTAGDTVVLLDVRLTEDYMRQIDSEFGWATLDCFRTLVQYTDKNAFGAARRLELTGRATKLGYGHPLAVDALRDFCNVKLGSKQLGMADDQFSDSVHYFIGATLRQPRLLGTEFVPSMSVYRERRGEFRAYLRHTLIGGDFSATRDLADRTPLRLGYSIEYGSTVAPDAALCALFNRCDPDSRRFALDRQKLGVASLSVARVRTDNPLSPTRGTTFRTELRSAQPFLLTSDSNSFNKGTGDLAYYTPIGRNVLALRVRGGVVLGRKLDASDVSGFIPPQERLYAGGPTSVRGFQQNELGDLVYIVTRGIREDTTIVPNGAGADTTYGFQVNQDPNAPTNPERTVPLGGNSLFVANAEFRTRVPFLLPDLLQFTVFVDGGDVWSQNGAFSMKWTPGLGVRAATPVGPVQMNIAHNAYKRQSGALYYNPNVSTLACATPGNTIQYRREANGSLTQVGTGVCPSFTPPERIGFLRKLTFTFSIGSDF